MPLEYESLMLKGKNSSEKRGVEKKRFFYNWMGMGGIGKITHLVHLKGEKGKA